MKRIGVKITEKQKDDLDNFMIDKQQDLSSCVRGILDEKFNGHNKTREAKTVDVEKNNMEVGELTQDEINLLSSKISSLADNVAAIQNGISGNAQQKTNNGMIKSLDKINNRLDRMENPEPQLIKKKCTDEDCGEKFEFSPDTKASFCPACSSEYDEDN